MKKVALILLMAVYGLATFGVGISKFYCCSKLKSVSFSFAEFDKGDCKVNNINSNCCEEKTQHIKVKDAHKASVENNFSPKPFPLPDTNYTSTQNFFFKSQQVLITYNIHGPPVFNNKPIHILNCVYRI